MRDWKSSLLDSCCDFDISQLHKVFVTKKKMDDLLISSQFFLLAYHSCSYIFSRHVKKNHGCFSKKESDSKQKTPSFMASWKVYRGRTGKFLGSHLAQELSLKRLGEMAKDMFEVECAGRHRYVYMIYIYIHRDNAYIYIYIHTLCILHVYKLISTRQCTRSSVQNRQIPIVKKVQSSYAPSYDLDMGQILPRLGRCFNTSDEMLKFLKGATLGDPFFGI